MKCDVYIYDKFSSFLTVYESLEELKGRTEFLWGILLQARQR